MSKRAGAVSAKTKEDLLKAAETEFSEKGFQKASLRKIASLAGVTTGALYFFFKNKDELFKEVISKITVPFTEFIRCHYEDEDNCLKNPAAKGEMQDIEVSELIIDLYYKEKKAWDILVSNMDHPAVKNFLQHFIDMSTEHYSNILFIAQQAGIKEKDVDIFDLRQFSTMQLNAFINLFAENLKREEMIMHANTVVYMLRAAFMALVTK